MIREGKAAVLTAFNKPLEIRTFPLPETAPGEVLVRVHAAGVCGSDVHMWEGRDPRIRLPLVLGHEGAGEIVALGGKKKDLHGRELRPGDLILWNRGVTCGSCYYCLVKDTPSLCPDRWVYGIHTSAAHPPYFTGNYAEYLLLAPSTAVFRLPDNADLPSLVAASCSGATAAHAAQLAAIEPGDKVLVLGAGPLGIYAVAFAENFGASRIIVIGGSPGRLSTAQALGATDTLNRRTQDSRQRREILLAATDGRGADVVFEMAGEPEALREAIDLTRPGGTCVSAGFGEPHGTISLDCFHDLNRKNLRLQGVWTSAVRHTHMALELALKQPELFRRIVTHTFPLAHAQEALMAVKNRRAGKAVILPQG
jgi:threonine dehydrogenase-like Zn-dependent dehydrogenase